MNLIYHTFPVGQLGCNCSIIGCPLTKEAIVIDPGDEKDQILAVLAREGLKVKYLLHTHAHFDHIGMSGPLRREGHGHILLHKEDLFLYENLEEQAGWFGIRMPDGEPVDTYINQGDWLEAGSVRLKVLHTPGHTPGSCSFVCPQASIVFTGDTLFRQSIGRTDLPGGDFEQILASIKEKLVTLDTDMVVVPGHGESSTIGFEKKKNPFLQN